MRALLPLLAVAVLSVACGGSEPPPATPATSTSAPAAAEAKGSSAEGHADGKDDHGKMKPALHDFHEVLAPIWHSTAGTDRVGKTCGGEKDLRAKAAAVGDAELIADAEAVKVACEKEGKTEVEAKLSTVHDRFHKLVEAK